MLILCVACGDDRAERPSIVASSTLPPPPDLPPDIETCPRSPHSIPADQIKALPASEVAIIVEGEKGKIRLMRSCLVRLICSVKEYRVLISKVEGERLCQDGSR